MPGVKLKPKTNFRQDSVEGGHPGLIGATAEIQQGQGASVSLTKTQLLKPSFKDQDTMTKIQGGQRPQTKVTSRLHCAGKIQDQKNQDTKTKIQGGQRPQTKVTSRLHCAGEIQDQKNQDTKTKIQGGQR